MSADQEPVGSLGSEAAKLIAALQDWARENGGEHVEAAASAASGAASFVADVDEHLATGGPDCTYCPLCRTISAVRESTSPEVRQHLRTAASSLLEAALGVIGSAAGPDGPRPSTAARRSDLDSDEREDD